MSESKLVQLQPAAELHWRGAVRRFGFTDTASLERHWSAACTNYTSVLLDSASCDLTLLGPGETEPVSMSLSHHEGVRELVREAYKVDSRPLWRRGELCVLKFAKRLPSYPRNNAKFAILGVDTYWKQVLCVLKLRSSDGKDTMRSVEIWDGILSKNKDVLGLSIGLLKHSHAIFDTFETFVTIFDVTTQEEVRRYSHLDNIMCAIDFDPRVEGKNYAIAGVCAEDAHSRYLATYTWRSDLPVKKRSVDFLLDLEADNQYYLSYTRDGRFVVLQILEGLGYSDEWLFNTYLFNSDSLDIVGKLHPALASGCHPSCTPVTRPVQSNCGDFLALPSAGTSRRRRDVDISVYRLPCRVNLQHQCRSVVLRSLRRPSADLTRLHLPRRIVHFLAEALPFDGRKLSV